MARKPEPKAPVEAKPYHHGDLKNALIDAGLRVMVKHGLDGLNLREVARVAGVSHAAPYRHFSDKHALVAAIADAGFEQLAAAVRAVDAARFANATARLAAAGSVYVCFANDHPDHFRLMFNRANERLGMAPADAVSKVGFEFLVRRIGEGQQRGELRPGDPLDMAKCLWSGMHGLAMLAIEDQLRLPQLPPAAHRAQLAALAETHVRMIIYGLRADART